MSVQNSFIPVRRIRRGHLSTAGDLPSPNALVPVWSCLELFLSGPVWEGLLPALSIPEVAVLRWLFDRAARVSKTCSRSSARGPRALCQDGESGVETGSYP